MSAKRAPFVCICRQSLSAKSRQFSVPWAFPFLALKRFVCILDKPCLQANISLSAFADKPCLHNRGRLRVPWTFPPPTFEIADESADKSADKVCLDMCLTNLFKNADARAAKIVQNADKSCLPKLQTKFVYSRQGLSILELALFLIPARSSLPRRKLGGAVSAVGGSGVGRRRRRGGSGPLWIATGATM